MKTRTPTRRNRLSVLAVFAVLWLSTLHLPAQADTVRIMPLGDSLTSSISGQASYRYWLWKRLELRHFQVDFVGSMWGVGDGSSANYIDFDQDHEGHPGATSSAILYGVGDWAARSQPDVVLLLVGANDIDYGLSPDDALASTRQIIETLRGGNPNVAILWALLPPSPQLKKEYRAYNSKISRYARAWSTKSSPIRAVNLWSGFNPARDTVDGEHPNVTGEKKFAARFYTPLVSILRHLQRQR